jgi:queuine tRNA-ribosyltransferase
MEIQHAIGADIIFAFDECTSPHAPLLYQEEALERTHRWAKRSLDYHREHRSFDQALFGIVQGGRFENLRKRSAKAIGALDFDGFGIGGSFTKEDMGNAVRWVNEILPEEKPRHLLGIGEPEDLFHAVLNGCDTFDCVSPTRMGRNGTLYTKKGKMNIMNSVHVSDFTPIEDDCNCSTCQHFTKAYLSHLFRSKEMLAGTLASLHNVYFLVQLVKKMRATILEGTFKEYMNEFLVSYKKS